MIAANRLWVWMPEVPGLVEALREQSAGSALVGTVSNGQLVWSSGVVTGLPLPSGVQNGDVVYLN